MECSICLQVLDENTTRVQIGCCKQWFHQPCYMRFMTVKPECPLCRARQEDLRVAVDVPPVVITQTPHQYVMARFIMATATAMIVGATLVTFIPKTFHT